MEHPTFQVAVKAILRKGEEILVLTTPDGYIDFPGGRIDQEEFDSSLLHALERELAEELGPEIKYDVSKIAFVSRRMYRSGEKTNRILAVYYDAQYVDGEPKLSDEHTEWAWVNPQSLVEKAESFVSEDEFNQYAAYFGY